MKIEELRYLLTEKGFKEAKLFTGTNYTKTIDHVELICYIEPNIEIIFTTIYRWNNNDVKGTYTVSMDEWSLHKESVPDWFKKTLKDMPECIGEKVDTHIEIINRIDDTFYD